MPHKRPTLDDLAEEAKSLDDLAREIMTLQAQRANDALRLAEAFDKNIKLRRELHRTRMSLSWRMTSPLRQARRVLSEVNSQVRALTTQPLIPRLSKAAISLYRRAPVPLQGRRFLHGLLFKLAPGRYASLLAAAGAIAPDQIAAIAAANTGVDDIVADPAFRAGFRRLVNRLGAHARRHGSATHMVVLPFFSVGGAQLVAANFSKVAAERAGSCILVAADKTLATRGADPAPGVLEIDLSDYFPNASGTAREHLLFALFRLARPKVLHVINSEVGWRVIIRMAPRMRPIARMFGSIFAFQFDTKTGEKVGYAAQYLEAAFPFLDGLISDNQRFIDDATNTYDLMSQRTKLHVIYNTSGAITETIVTRGRLFSAGIAERTAQVSRASILWAGRLDAEKRPDLLIAVASICADMDFHVYGQRVVDGNFATVLEQRANIYFHGPYRSAEEVCSQRDHHAMMFTSNWEGLPNVLIEFGVLGVPIVAATVGGVRELISEDTGYPLPERPLASDYVSALRAVLARPREASARSGRLISLIAERHSRTKFEQSIAAIPSYWP